MRNFRPRRLLSAPNYPSAEVHSLEAAAARLGIEHRELHEGDSFTLDGVAFEVLSPPADWVLKSHGQDDSSLVLRLTYAGHSALLVGDIHQKVERRIVEEAAAAGRPLAAELLKVPHHGSSTSSSAEFLAAVHPEYAVISAGVRNPFHHPRPDVLARLESAQARTYRTDLFGPVTFYLDAAGVHPEVQR
jgi:competence protein ComEC